MQEYVRQNEHICAEAIGSDVIELVRRVGRVVVAEQRTGRGAAELRRRHRLHVQQLAARRRHRARKCCAQQREAAKQQELQLGNGHATALVERRVPRATF